MTFTIPGSDIRLPRLGYGCASLMARTSQAESVRLLEEAFCAGITHFDVARSYGYGDAERAVGDFMGGRRDAVTVTTKLGLLPPARSTRIQAAKAIMRRIAVLHPRLRRTLRDRASRMVKGGAFSIADARTSLETSLRELRTDRVDLLLLHDCAPHDLSPELLELLHGWEREGLVRAFGIATGRAEAETIAATAPQFAAVVQVPDSVLLSPLSSVLGERVLTHSALGASYAELTRRMREPHVSRRLGALAIDLRDPAMLARFMLAAALLRNPDGTVLTSSRNPEHIRANARVSRAPPPRQQVEEFGQAVAQLGAPTL